MFAMQPSARASPQCICIVVATRDARNPPSSASRHMSHSGKPSLASDFRSSAEYAEAPGAYPDVARAIERRRLPPIRRGEASPPPARTDQGRLCRRLHCGRAGRSCRQDRRPDAAGAGLPRRRGGGSRWHCPPDRARHARQALRQPWRGCRSLPIRAGWACPMRAAHSSRRRASSSEANPSNHREGVEAGGVEHQDRVLRRVEDRLAHDVEARVEQDRHAGRCPGRPRSGRGRPGCARPSRSGAGRSRPRGRPPAPAPAPPRARPGCAPCRGCRRNPRTSPARASARIEGAKGRKASRYFTLALSSVLGVRPGADRPGSSGCRAPAGRTPPAPAPSRRARPRRGSGRRRGRRLMAEVARPGAPRRPCARRARSRRASRDRA